jgi:hypothetical protein
LELWSAVKVALKLKGEPVVCHSSGLCCAWINFATPPPVVRLQLPSTLLLSLEILSDHFASFAVRRSPCMGLMQHHIRALTPLEQKRRQSEVQKAGIACLRGSGFHK